MDRPQYKEEREEELRCRYDEVLPDRTSIDTSQVLPLHYSNILIGQLEQERIITSTNYTCRNMIFFLDLLRARVLREQDY